MRMPNPAIRVTTEVPPPLPLVSAGEVEGTLVKPGGTSLPGVGLELLDVEGRVVRETQTEFDGFFLFEGVPYGEYGVQIAKLSAQALKISQRLPGRAVVGEENQVARLGTVVANFDTVLAEAPIGQPLLRSAPEL